jgi:hypothetical protein
MNDTMNKTLSINEFSADDTTLDLQQAAAFLHMSPAVLRQKACRGIVKGAKPGKCWVFLKSDLVLYLHSLYPMPDCYQSEQTPCSDWKEVSPCHSINAVKSGGSALPPPEASEYANLLKLPVSNKRKNSMID